MGSAATTPFSESSGAYEVARSPANSDAWPPCDTPIATHDRPAPTDRICRTARIRSIMLWPSALPENSAWRCPFGPRP